MSRPLAVVTGVSRRAGIGAAIARELVAAQWDLLLVGHRHYDETVSGLAVPDEEPFIEELRETGSRVEELDCDLSDPDSAERVFEAARRLGQPVALVNNATHSENTSLSEVDATTLDNHYAINLRAPVLLTRAFVARFRGDWGRVVNMTSGQGLGPMPGELAYASTKGGLEAFTTSLAPALAPLRITVNAVDPGVTDNGWMSEEQRRAFVAPMGRLGVPADAARLVRFLLSEEAGWITGQVIRSRGGG